MQIVIPKGMTTEPFDYDKQNSYFKILIVQSGKKDGYPYSNKPFPHLLGPLV